MRANWTSRIRNISTVIVIFGISLLGIIWVGLYCKVQSERQLEIDNAIKETATYARMFEEHTIRTLKGLDEITLFLKYQAENDGLRSIDLPRLIRERRFEGHPFLVIGVVGENGDLVASTHVPFVSLNNGDLEYLQAHRSVDSGKLFVGKLMAGRASGKMTIPLSRRINKSDGSFGGVVVVAVDPNYFIDFYKQVNLGENSSITLMGTDGIVRVRQVEDEIQMGTDLNQRMKEKMSARPGGSYLATGNADGISRVYSYRALPGYPLLVAVGESEEHIFADLNQRVVGYYRIAGAISAGVILFVGLLVLDVSRRKKAEEAMRASQSRYQALMEQSFEALALIDMQTREVLEINHRFTELFGYSLPDDAPLYVNQFVVDSPQNLDRIYQSTLNQQRFLPMEERIFRHKNGSKVHVERTGSVVSVDGRDLYLASMRDMTAERRRQGNLNRDVEFARRVQQGLLPVLPDSRCAIIRSLYCPANFVSGDSYHLEWQNDGTLLRGFLIDVSGHGLSTAIQTSSINVLLREAATFKLSLLEQMRLVNKRAAKYFTDDAYAAILGFELDFSHGELNYVGAGITQFYANGKKIETPGMFVGMWDDAEFEAGKLVVAAGDSFCFLTDGFTDALAQPENAGFWSPGGLNFDADVAALERMAESGTLHDDASGVCLKVLRVG